LTLHDLLQLARSLQVEPLEQAWAAAARNPRAEDAPRFRAAVEALCDRDMAGKALQFCTTMVQAMAGNDLLDEAIELAQSLLHRGVQNEGLVQQLSGLLQHRFGEADWYPLLSARAGFGGEDTDAQALVAFDRLRRFTPRNAVYHAGGWGEGVIEEFHADRVEVTVAFVTGRRSDFPLETVLDRFRPLDPDDLRAMRMLQADTLREMAVKDPSQLIRKAARLYRNTINSSQLKAELCPAVLSEKEWPGYWKRAKSAATKDPWLRVDGSASRPVFVVRDKPVGIGEEASKAVRIAGNLGERIAVLRDYLARSQDEEVRRQVLDLAEATVAQAIIEKTDSHAHMLDGILLLEEQGRRPPTSHGDELRALLIGPDGSLQPQALDQLATQESRERAVRLLPETLGPTWADTVVGALTSFPDSVLENIVQMLAEHGHGERIYDVWNMVAPFPYRYPVLTYLCGRLYADGAFDSRPDKATPVVVGRALLDLARVLTAGKRGNPALARLLGRVASLLAGKRGFLARAMADIGREDLAGYLGITERGGEEFPQEIVDAVLRVVARRHPDLTEKPERPFWEKEEFIYTTREGLRRIKEDYRVLVEEKIPANSKAIGHAAALGDLSENSEWEAAMEEQRNLTTRATVMDREIKSTRLLESQELPDGVVAPGTQVGFVEVDTGTRRELTLLGPWDARDEGTINYRAPLAQLLLGRKIGDEVMVPSAHGPTLARIETIVRVI
jgi:transcription elongation GreA/GreB family factor